MGYLPLVFMPICRRRLAVLVALVLGPSHLHASLDAGLDLDVQGLSAAVDSGAPWTMTGTVTHDGEDAGMSASLSHGQSSGFQFSLVGPDTVSFWWKVSSEKDYDTLTVTVGNESQEISGETEWREVVLDVPAGLQVLRWEYAKDEDFSEGQDRAWVDEIRVASRTIPAVSYPPVVGAYLGEPFSITPTLRGETTGYTLVGSSPSWITFDTQSGQISGMAPTTGDVMLAITAQNSNGSSTQQSVLIRTRDLGSGLEALVSGWQWQGDQPWSTQSIHTHDEIDALRSGPIGDNESSELLLPVTGPAVIRFWWRVDSEGSHDRLAFLIDGEEVQVIDDLVDWERRAISVSAGSHIVSWRYDKDHANTQGEDAAWIDDVEVIDGRDPDSDGLSSLVEVCLGQDWRQPSHDLLPLPTETGGRLAWQVTKGTDLLGLTPVIEISYDLRSWSKAPLMTITDTTTTLSVQEFSVNQADRKFVRLRAQVNP